LNDDWLYRYKNRIILRIVIVLALSMCGAVIVTILLLRDQLINEIATNTRQIGGAITSSLRAHMLANSPDKIRQTLDDIASDKSISQIFIIDRDGRIAYSSNTPETGKILDRMSDESCRGCHKGAGPAPTQTFLVIDSHTNTNDDSISGGISRSVNVIRNEPACYGCHPQSVRILGKVIIDRPLESTHVLIRSIEFILLTSGVMGLLLVIPIISRLINRYIDQILLKKEELALVYSIINNISKTIDIIELQHIVLDITNEVLSAEEVDIILPKGDGCRVVTRTRDGEKLVRKKPEPGEPLSAVIERWQNDLMHSQEVSGDRTEIYLPIEKGGHRLALIAARSSKSPFSNDRVALVEAVCNHYAIAFENARLYSIAITDELTGLFTVRHFRTCLDRHMESLERYGERFTLLFIDIDNFKRVNDVYGHVIGDEVLKHVAGCIAESVRSNDLAFRYGGEEFAVILPSTGRSGGLHVAERIRAQVESNRVVLADGDVLSNTVSIGLSICPDNVTTLKELILEADKALYAAKRSGKNRTVACGEKSDLHPPEIKPE